MIAQTQIGGEEVKVKYKVEIGTQEDPQVGKEGHCEFYMVGTLPQSVGDFTIILEREPKVEDVLTIINMLKVGKP